MATVADLVREDFGIQGSGRWLRSDIHSSLVVDTENDFFYFNSRGLRGNALDYLTKVRGIDKHLAQELIKNTCVGMPVDAGNTTLQAKFEKLVDLFHGAGRQDRDYWYDRKLTDQTIDRYRLGNFDGWNLIPIYDKGYFINFQCRRDKPDKRIRLWYKDEDFKPVLFNKEVLPFITTAYITEGMVDCLLLNQLGMPAVCSTNGAGSWNQGWTQYFNKIDQVYYIEDNDKAGRIGSRSVAMSLGMNKVKIVRFYDRPDKYDTVDFFRDGGSVVELKSLVNESKYIFEL